MKVSIISPIKNNVKTIERTIKSVIREKENGTDIEFIIADGLSTDGTIEVINKYKEHIDIFESRKDNGINQALNRAIKISTGDYILTLAGDDYLLNNSLNNFSKLVKKNIDVFSAVSVRPLNNKLIFLYPENDLSKLHYYCSLNHTSSLFNRCVFDKYGFYDETLVCSADREMFLRLYTNGANFQIEKLPLVYFEYGGISSHLNFDRLFEDRSVSLKYGMNKNYAEKYYSNMWNKVNGNSIIMKLLYSFKNRFPNSFIIKFVRKIIHNEIKYLSNKDILSLGIYKSNMS